MPDSKPSNPAPQNQPPTLKIWVVVLVACVVMGGGVGIAWLLSGGVDALVSATTPSKPTPTPEATPAAEATPIPVASAIPVTPEIPRAIPLNATPIPVATPLPSNEEVAAPPVAVDFNPGAEGNKDVKTEVLKRIDLMPTLKPEEKDKLYTQVDRAREMGLLISIPFGSAKSALGPKEIENLKKATLAPSVQRLVTDPTVVFVILGYADTKGNPAANFKVSLARADNVVEVLRDKCGFQNVMHSVAMGGSDFFDAKQTEKNRLVEVWAVLP